MPAKRKTAFKIALHRKAVGLHEPGAVGILSAEQERDAFAIHVVCRRDACNVEGIQGLSGRIGIRWRAAELRPTAACFLPFTNVLYCNGHTTAWSIRPYKAHQPHCPFFR